MCSELTSTVRTAAAVLAEGTCRWLTIGDDASTVTLYYVHQRHLVLLRQQDDAAHGRQYRFGDWIQQARASVEVIERVVTPVTKKLVAAIGIKTFGSD